MAEVRTEKRRKSLAHIMMVKEKRIKILLQWQSDRNLTCSERKVSAWLNIFSVWKVFGDFSLYLGFGANTARKTATARGNTATIGFVGCGKNTFCVYQGLKNFQNWCFNDFMGTSRSRLLIQDHDPGTFYYWNIFVPNTPNQIAAENFVCVTSWLFNHLKSCNFYTSEVGERRTEAQGKGETTAKEVFI